MYVFFIKNELRNELTKYRNIRKIRKCSSLIIQSLNLRGRKEKFKELLVLK